MPLGAGGRGVFLAAQVLPLHAPSTAGVGSRTFARLCQLVERSGLEVPLFQRQHVWKYLYLISVFGFGVARCPTPDAVR